MEAKMEEAYSNILSTWDNNSPDSIPKKRQRNDNLATNSHCQCTYSANGIKDGPTNKANQMIENKENILGLGQKRKHSNF